METKELCAPAVPAVELFEKKKSNHSLHLPSVRLKNVLDSEIAINLGSYSGEMYD